jgi:hypothetical protein
MKNLISSSKISKREKLNVLPKGKTISIGSNKLYPINPNNYCTSLVVRGSNLGSNIGLKFNNNDLKTLYLTSFITQVLVGILLGNIRLPSKKGNPQIQYNQGFIHLNYMLHNFNILSPILTHLPTLIQRKDLSTYLHSRCLACL